MATGKSVDRTNTNAACTTGAGNDCLSGGGDRTGKKAGGKRSSTARAANPTLQQLQTLTAELHQLQGETPLVPVHVDGHIVAEIVAAWTGIPLGKMVKDEINTVLNLQAQLETRVIGQSHAIAAIAQRVRTSRANLDDPNKPKGVFLLSVPAASAKPKPRWRWPKPSTAVRKSSSPST